MKTKELQHFLEKGYLQFPYIVIRQAPAVYVQIPVHRWELRKHFTEGLFLNPEKEELLGYEETCHRLFEEFCADQAASNGPMDMCLVLNRDKACFISKRDTNKKGDNKRAYGPTPWGGMLFSCVGELMRLNQAYYIL